MLVHGDSFEGLIHPRAKNVTTQRDGCCWLCCITKNVRTELCTHLTMGDKNQRGVKNLLASIFFGEIVQYFRCFKTTKDSKLNNRWTINWEAGVKWFNSLVVSLVKADINTYYDNVLNANRKKNVFNFTTINTVDIFTVNTWFSHLCPESKILFETKKLLPFILISPKILPW